MRSAQKTGDNSSRSKCVIGGGRRGVAVGVYKKIMGMQSRMATASTNQGGSLGKQTAFDTVSLSMTELNALETEVKALAVANGAAATATVKMYLGWMRSRMHLRNQSNSVVKMTLYDVVTKRNPGGTSIDTPTEVWNLGISDAGGSNLNEIGETPYKSPLFKRYFSIRKVSIIDLEPG